jgi:hypothetical protein
MPNEIDTPNSDNRLNQGSHANPRDAFGIVRHSTCWMLCRTRHSIHTMATIRCFWLASSTEAAPGRCFSYSAACKPPSW